jgi:dsDNA-specific endonuclease/ATPase MutS2
LLAGNPFLWLCLDENEYFDRKALVFSIVNFNKKSSFANSGGLNVTELLKEKVSKDKPKPVSREEKKTNNGPEEVDLHIESITDNYSGLSNSEIVDLQMARFKISLDTAVIHKTRRIVFIHGVGNGKLKFTIRKALDDKYPDLQYQDASFKEYGYGATMVIIP